MKVECSICGAIHDDHWMIKLNTGIHTQHLCWECYLQGQREAHLNEVRRAKAITKLTKNKKRG